MLLARKPSNSKIADFIASQRDREFSYAQVGASRNAPPLGFAVDHNRICLGHGASDFEKAVRCLRSWRMFELRWLHLFWPNTPIEVGSTVAVLANVFGLWSLNACRIVYVFDDNSTVRRLGFAYGTLLEHAECGEERFAVEWNQSDDSVWYDLFAFSRPARVSTRIGYPMSRRIQRRFARESLVAMQAAVRRGA